MNLGMHCFTIFLFILSVSLTLANFALGGSASTAADSEEAFDNDNKNNSENDESISELVPSSSYSIVLLHHEHAPPPQHHHYILASTVNTTGSSSDTSGVTSRIEAVVHGDHSLAKHVLEWEDPRASTKNFTTSSKAHRRNTSDQNSNTHPADFKQNQGNLVTTQAILFSASMALVFGAISAKRLIRRRPFSQCLETEQMEDDMTYDQAFTRAASEVDYGSFYHSDNWSDFEKFDV